MAVLKSCSRWIESQKVGDKAHLITPEDDNISDEGDREKSRKNGSVAMAGVAAALTDVENGKAKSQK